MVRLRGWLVAGIALLLAVPAPAAESDKTAASLRLVPANVGFYSAMLRNKEQWDAFVHSRAFAAIKNLPAVQMGLKHLEAQTKDNQQFQAIHQMMQQPENQELIALLGEAVGDEIFLAGGHGWGDFAELATRLNWANQFGFLQLMASGKGLGRDPNKLRITALLMVLAEHPKLVKFPDTVIGFRLPDAKKADTQIKRLEALTMLLGAIIPQAQGRVKRVDINEGSYLTLDLDGSLVPWDQIPLGDFELEAGQFDNLIKQLKEVKLHITLGVRGNYMLLGLGGSTGLLNQLGKGQHLADNPDLKPLGQFADRPLTSIGYVSKALRQRGATDPKDLDGLVTLAKEGLDKTDLDDAQKKKILKDVADLADELKKDIPTVGSALGFSFWSDKGQESFNIDNMRFARQIKPRPLTLLQHLGGNPILGGVALTEIDGSGYKFLVKWIKKAWGHADDILNQKLDGDKKEMWEKFKKEALPLFARFDEITSTQLLPSMAEGQIGLVLDAKITSKQWHKQMPESDKPLPMLEIGLLLGLKDGHQFTKALASYGELIQDGIKAVRGFDPAGNIPDITIPPPETTKKGAVTYYSYAIPEPAQLDEKIKPTAGISEKLAVFTLSTEHAERLQARKPLKTAGTVLADPAKPLVSAAVFDFRALIDAVKPWVEFGVTMANRGEGQKAEDIIKQVAVVAEVLKCFHGVTSATYVEDGKTVTHSISVVRDLEKGEK
jgi:hypothetical protein